MAEPDVWLNLTHRFFITEASAKRKTSGRDPWLSTFRRFGPMSMLVSVAKDTTLVWASLASNSETPNV